MKMTAKRIEINALESNEHRFVLRFSPTPCTRCNRYRIGGENAAPACT
jgi:hypothetical protein